MVLAFMLKKLFSESFSSQDVVGWQCNLSESTLLCDVVLACLYVWKWVRGSGFVEWPSFRIVLFP